MDDMAANYSHVESCPIKVQNVFGPQVKGCNGDFDFTLLFEESFLAIPLMAAVILVAVPRIRYLSRGSIKVNGGLHHHIKLVRIL